MKVEELIDKLKELPKDAEVTYYHDYNHENMVVTEVTYTKKDDGDGMSPMNSIDNQVVLG